MYTCLISMGSMVYLNVLICICLEIIILYKFLGGIKHRTHALNHYEHIVRIMGLWPAFVSAGT